MSVEKLTSVVFRANVSAGNKLDRWPYHVRLSDIESDFVCTACGKRGADARPDFLTEKKRSRG